MRVAALCPTYRRPKMLAQLLECWLAQDYSASLRRLFILDDGGTFAAQTGATWELHAADDRYPSLPAKFNALAGVANRWNPEAYVVMEDDDVYLPRYVSSHAAVLQAAEYSKPSVVLSDYPGHVIEERAEGRFHGSIGFRRSLCDRIGGWPETLRADFDQQMLARLREHAASVGDPYDLVPPQYVFRWHTGHWHGQNAMRGPGDEGWYERIGECSPRFETHLVGSSRITSAHHRPGEALVRSSDSDLASTYTSFLNAPIVLNPPQSTLNRFSVA